MKEGRVNSWNSPGYTTSSVGTPRRRKLRYICSPLITGTFPSTSPPMMRVGVVILVTRLNGDSFSHNPRFSQGSPSSYSQSREYKSWPQFVTYRNSPAPEIAALKRAVCEIIKFVEIPP